jgi:hypothetical protein
VRLDVCVEQELVEAPTANAEYVAEQQSLADLYLYEAV